MKMAFTSCDIIIYGASSAGIAAGIQAKREGRTVVVLEPGSHIGGLTTGGLGQTDIGNKHVIGGIAREFYRGIRDYYAVDDHWQWQARSAYRDGGQTQTSQDEDAMWTFEPKAAQCVLNQMISDAGLEVVTHARLERKNGVMHEGGRIQHITLEDGRCYKAQVFIDATYEGDLMAAAGVTYAMGREGNEPYGETLNGVQADDFNLTLRGLEDLGWDRYHDILRRGEFRTYYRQGYLSLNAFHHQLASGIDPYNEPGVAGSGLLPGVHANGPGKAGEGDDRVQAYNIRITLTNNPDNGVRIECPDEYDPRQYELLVRHLALSENKQFWINSAMPNAKTDTNNGGGFSTDFIGENTDWCSLDYDARVVSNEAHRHYTQGLLWTLANDERICETVRNEVSGYYLPGDEYVRNGHWSPQLYVREGRRMRGELVMTQHHCEGYEKVDDSIGMAAYGLDSHHMQRYLDAQGYVCNEGNVEAKVVAPYAVSYRAIIPQRRELTNLIVPIALSASHIAFGSIRMEPVFMVLGQSAATAASLALQNQSDVQAISYPVLKEKLEADRQILSAD